MYKTTVHYPIGSLLLASDGTAITGLWLEGQKYFAAGLDSDAEENPALPVFQKASSWLDAYFAQRDLPPLPPLAPVGSPFRLSVWERLQAIPYGQTRTYGELSAELHSSPRAVGSAVGHNPISILIPCHRVLGTDGSLTGYAGGLNKKELLLKLEGVL